MCLIDIRDNDAVRLPPHDIEVSANPGVATLIGMLSGTVVDHDELVLRTRLMEEAPSVLARNLEQYAHTARLLSAEIGRRAGQDPDRDLDPSLLASAVMNALATAIGLWYRRGAEDDLTDLVVEALDRTGSGLSP